MTPNQIFKKIDSSSDTDEITLTIIDLKRFGLFIRDAVMKEMVKIQNEVLDEIEQSMIGRKKENDVKKA